MKTEKLFQTVRKVCSCSLIALVALTKVCKKQIFRIKDLRLNDLKIKYTRQCVDFCTDLTIMDISMNNAN